MTRSGKRPVKGKQNGRHSSSTKKIAGLAISDGITPLGVLLNNMRFYDSVAENLLPGVMHAAGRGDLNVATDLCDEVEHLRARAFAVAKMAAPYYDRRAAGELDDVEQENATSPEPGPPTEDRLAHLVERFCHPAKRFGIVNASGQKETRIGSADEDPEITSE